MRPHKVIRGAGKRERELMFQVILFLGEGIDLTPRAVGMLTDRQVVALHAVGIDGRAHGWGFQRGDDLLFISVDDPSQV